MSQALLHRLKADMRTLGQLAVGITILTVTLGLLCVVQFPVLLLAFLAPIIATLFNLIWFGVIIALVICGIAWSKPGLSLAPLLFVALWAGAAIFSQWRLQASIDPKVWERPISPEASAQRTLIVKTPRGIENKIVADGHVDRLIRLRLDSSSQKISRIEEVSLARDAACSAEEQQASPQLRNDGRSGECFKWRSLATIPDGLVIEQFYRINLGNGGAGCCNETQARLRSGGQERLLFAWYQGQSYVPSYFPTFEFFSRSTRLWEIGFGIAHPVRYGLDDIDATKMISAIYGVTPPYGFDGGGPVPLAKMTATETLDQALMLAGRPDFSPKSLAALLMSARDEGIIDDRSIDVAASLTGRGPENEGWTAVTDFAKGLSSDQTKLLLEKLLQRLETPGVCVECVASSSVVNPSLRDWKLRERLSNPDSVLERVRNNFVERHDLATWQYEGLLGIIISLGPQGYPAITNYIRSSILPLIFLDDTPAYSSKAIAFLRATHGRPTNEAGRLAAKLDLVRDNDRAMRETG
ncbi:hypothetical protein, partial [Bradyrhizobium liaoningense]|uniref:hypothetical protein n=1 Tax=Bradyrhizobium liaoningense TaxID=43992 RepID=UPI00054E23CC